MLSIKIKSIKRVCGYMADSFRLPSILINPIDQINTNILFIRDLI